MGHASSHRLFCTEIKPFIQLNRASCSTLHCTCKFEGVTTHKLVPCSVLDRLSFLLEESEQSELAASSVMLMSRAKFEDKFLGFKAWQQQRDTAQHVNLWQSNDPLSVLGSLDQAWASSMDLHDISRTTAGGHAT